MPEMPEKPKLGYVGQFFVCEPCARKRGLHDKGKIDERTPVMGLGFQEEARHEHQDPQRLGIVSTIEGSCLSVETAPWYCACIVCGGLACAPATARTDAYTIDVAMEVHLFENFEDDEETDPLQVSFDVEPKDPDPDTCAEMEYWIAANYHFLETGKRSIPFWNLISPGHFHGATTWTPDLIARVVARGYKLNLSKFREPSEKDIEAHARIKSKEAKAFS